MATISNLKFSKIIYFASHNFITFIGNIFHHKFGKCTVCGRTTFFYCHDLNGVRGSMICVFCRSCSRNRHIAKIILNTFSDSKKEHLNEISNELSKLDIYQASAKGGLNKVLSNSPKYICSEYFDNVIHGEKNSHGILCEDLQNLSFPDNSFDLIITEDVFEHIRHPELAWNEIKRVLKPGGYHIFSMPFHFDRITFKRIDVSSDKDIFIVPPRYHGDSLRNEGIIVYNDFGVDLYLYLESIGLPTEVFINSYSDLCTSCIYESYVFRQKNL